jgi:heparan-alpha-glucosaminide N-acetyltransferase
MLDGWDTDPKALLLDGDGDSSKSEEGGGGQQKPTPSKHARLVCLDIQRGFTMALMIFADEIGAAYPHLNHSHWNNITMADFVMPWFLFMVGTSMAFSLRKFQRDIEAKKKGARFISIRAMRLYCLGLLLSGRGWVEDYEYGYNLRGLRWCGILQRIAFAYFVVAAMEIWIPKISVNNADVENQSTIRANMQIFKAHGYKWAVASLFMVLYLILTFAVHVPSWHSHYEDVYGQPSRLRDPPALIKCDVVGALTPQCSANSYFDRMLFGQRMLRSWMAQRGPECSSCPPGIVKVETHADGPPTVHNCFKEDAPVWCSSRMYDPEGVLATIPSIMSTWLGLHFGHVCKFAHPALSDPRTKLMHWVVVSALLMVIGLTIHYGGYSMNKQLWTPSYVFFMAGSCGAFLALWYALVDVQWQAINQRMWARILNPMRTMGMVR